MCGGNDVGLCVWRGVMYVCVCVVGDDVGFLCRGGMSGFVCVCGRGMMWVCACVEGENVILCVWRG